MKASTSILTVLFSLTLVSYAGVDSHPLTTNATQPRIGTYNSRAVALAYGRSERHNAEVKKLMAEAKQAEIDHDQARLARLKKQGSAQQDRLHRQVFGKAPIDDILRLIQPDVPVLLKQANVEKFVATPLNGSKGITVDVTELLVNYFKPTEATRKMIADLEKQPPLPASKFPLHD